MKVYHCSRSECLPEISKGEFRGTHYMGSLGRGLYFFCRAEDAFEQATKTKRSQPSWTITVFEVDLPLDHVLVADYDLWCSLTDQDYPRESFVTDQLDHYGVRYGKDDVEGALVRADAFFSGRRQSCYGGAIRKLLEEGSLSTDGLTGIIARDYNKDGLYGVYFQYKNLSGSDFRRMPSTPERIGPSQ